VRCRPFPLLPRSLPVPCARNCVPARAQGYGEYHTRRPASRTSPPGRYFSRAESTPRYFSRSSPLYTITRPLLAASPRPQGRGDTAASSAGPRATSRCRQARASDRVDGQGPPGTAHHSTGVHCASVRCASSARCRNGCERRSHQPALRRLTRAIPPHASERTMDQSLQRGRRTTPRE
jgi:hypothetical protein